MNYKTLLSIFTAGAGFIQIGKGMPLPGQGYRSENTQLESASSFSYDQPYHTVAMPQVSDKPSSWLNFKGSQDNTIQEAKPSAFLSSSALPPLITVSPSYQHQKRAEEVG